MLDKCPNPPPPFPSNQKTGTCTRLLLKVGDTLEGCMGGFRPDLPSGRGVPHLLWVGPCPPLGGSRPDPPPLGGGGTPHSLRMGPGRTSPPPRSFKKKPVPLTLPSRFCSQNACDLQTAPSPVTEYQLRPLHPIAANNMIKGYVPYKKCKYFFKKSTQILFITVVPET